MALILHLETATTVCSVSLAKEGNVLALKEIDGEYSHAENLTVFIEDVLKQAGLSLKEIDSVAVSKGPGSYTGLRIGVSTAKGLCYSLDKPLIAINTLEHIAQSFFSHFTNRVEGPLPSFVKPPTLNLKPKTILLCPMLDARRMEVYCAVYDNIGNEVRATAAEIIDENSFSDLLKENEVIFFGDGAAKCKEVLSKNVNATFIDGIIPSAKNMARLAEKAFFEKRFEDIAYFEPFYLKDFVAGKPKKVQ